MVREQNEHDNQHLTIVTVASDRVGARRGVRGRVRHLVPTPSDPAQLRALAVSGHEVSEMKRHEWVLLIILAAMFLAGVFWNVGVDYLVH